GAASAQMGMVYYLVNNEVTIAGHTFGWFDTIALFVACGLSMRWNAIVFDGLKQRLTPDSPDADVAKYKDDVRTWFDRVLYTFWADYVKRIAPYHGETDAQ